jgi:hypothetical protein
VPCIEAKAVETRNGTSVEIVEPPVGTSTQPEPCIETSNDAPSIETLTKALESTSLNKQQLKKKKNRKRRSKQAAVSTSSLSEVSLTTVDTTSTSHSSTGGEVTPIASLAASSRSMSEMGDSGDEAGQHGGDNGLNVSETRHEQHGEAKEEHLDTNTTNEQQQFNNPMNMMMSTGPALQQHETLEGCGYIMIGSVPVYIPRRIDPPVMIEPEPEVVEEENEEQAEVPYVSFLANKQEILDWFAGRWENVAGVVDGWMGTKHGSELSELVIDLDEEDDDYLMSE